MMNDKLKKATEASIKAMQEFTKVAEQMGASLATPQWVPEVGDECLWRDNERDARRVIVMGFYEDSVWLRIIDGQTPITVHYNAASFSPLPTEEDRAVVDMTDVMRGTDVMLTGANQECIARALYQHGYRKQPQPAEPEKLEPYDWYSRP